MSPQLPLESRLAQSWPPERWAELTILVAVSGGADSVALLRALHSLAGGGAGRLAVGHFNHQLRGQESQADEQFVGELCQELGVPCLVGYPSSGSAGSFSEAAARTARYAFLQETASRLGARYVVTAHTADDQVETILHRILRGTGIAGLAGMERVRPLGPLTLIRPLLGFRRAELREYLARLGQPYRSDSSNADLRFTRNRLRHELLPSLAAQFNPSVDEALLRLGQLAGEVQAVIDRLVDRLWAEAVSEAPPGVIAIEARRLQGQERYLVRQLLLTVWQRLGWPLGAMGFSGWDLLADMLAAAGEPPSPAPRKQLFPGAILAELVGDRLLLSGPVR